jgi:DNA-binding MarR family transcriptional regulator
MALIALSIQDGASVSELALALGTDIKSASRLVKQLRARGWATVEADASDERLRRVRLTRAGKHLAELLTGGLIDLAFRIVQGDTADVLRQEILVKELRDATRQAHRGAAKPRARRRRALR